MKNCLKVDRSWEPRTQMFEFQVHHSNSQMSHIIHVCQICHVSDLCQIWTKTNLHYLYKRLAREKDVAWVLVKFKRW